jgi:hypothetical protein
MDKEAIFEAWAPSGRAWSDWVKPVLFAHLPRRRPEVGAVGEQDISWAPGAEQRCAIVVELPGVESVAMGLALAKVGYRPVPLFNACPPPEADGLFLPIQDKPRALALVDVESILAALVQGAEGLQSLDLPADAPPVFLLDALRKSPRRSVDAGLFDNRSVVFVTDFPSANALATRGVREAIVVVKAGLGFQDDLDHVLKTWSRDGLSLSLKRLDRDAGPQPLELPRPSVFFGLWLQIATWFGLRRNPKGGFGAFVPFPSAG